MEVLRSIDSPVVFSLNSLNSGILITNPLNGTISVPATSVNIPVDLYKWRIRLRLQNDEVKTYLMGHWQIVSNLPQNYWEVMTKIPEHSPLPQ
jgi:hypothetical protein